MDLNLTDDERRALAGELADALAARGLALGDIERLAPLLVDRFRLAWRVAPTVAFIRRVKRRQVQTVDQVADVMCKVPFGQPVAHIRRQQRHRLRARGNLRKPVDEHDVHGSLGDGRHRASADPSSGGGWPACAGRR